MRDIKFRGKTINEEKYENGKDGWIYGNLSVLKNGIVAIQDTSDSNLWKRVSLETVGQYIGLKDKNGVEIYEGDILKYAGGGIYIVIFEEMMIMCPHDNIEMPSPGYYGILVEDKTKELCPLGCTQYLSKVIGNIYDNKELLEE